MESRSEKYEEMIKKYPHLYADRNASMMVTCMCWGIECGIGWYDIIDKLSADLESMILKLPPDQQEQIKASQIKEKYGSLHFYMTSETKEMSQAISKAEKLSRTICEDCGKPGKNQELFGWWRTRCHDCYMKSLVTGYSSRLQLLVTTGISISQEDWDKYKNEK